MESDPREEPEAFVDRMFAQAIDRGASDLYWLPCANRLNIRLRRDGIQEDLADVPCEYGAQCVARIKVMSRLLTYRTKIAQDGVIRDFVHRAGAELRVSVMPTSRGERVSIRIQRTDHGPLYLEDLKFAPEVILSLRAMLERPSGLLVLTGPTGSGKTTTIYAMIRELLRSNQDPASIITIEDPIECAIDGISQTSVSEGDGWGYAAALRSALRHDIKTLVVGEMRDPEVVRVTLDAALTGHRIITTFHAGDIPSVYARLLHQGFEPFLVAAAVTGVVSQRLIPRRDKAGQVPVVATLVPNDAWRDFITQNPGLGALRKQIARYPAADLPTVAGSLVQAELITESEQRRICADQSDASEPDGAP
ncbi:MAG: hypothetical protein A2498_10685 [Lentisphaerae bacterium RIFOXYC12_FULL_60_16]|nr:MAG: hypothetical protein A2498_10685 [Lentisphaerae bacterium RIFOXYC12_FULL_60_16]